MRERIVGRAKIKITPGMLKAGIEAADVYLDDYRVGDSSVEATAVAVFEAMTRAAPGYVEPLPTPSRRKTER